MKIKPYCKFNNCKNVSHRRLFCRKHYKLYLISRNIEDEYKERIQNSIIRFWNNIDTSSNLGPNGDCWEWTKAKDSSNYGQTFFNGKKQKAHRLAWYLIAGVWPADMLLHNCDNTICCNVNHLREGSAKENCADMYSRGRALNGEKAYRAKLKEWQVLEIRTLFTTEKFSIFQLSKLYNVSSGTIYHVVHGLTWKHLL